MKHHITAMLMTTCINENLWDKGERSEIINAAINIHLKRREEESQGIRKRNWKKRRTKCWLNLQSMKSKVRRKVKVEMKMDFQKTTRGCFNRDFYFLTNILLLFFVQLYVFYIQLSIFILFMKQTDDMALPYRVQIKLLRYLHYLINATRLYLSATLL